jgi:hypothetical protein
MAFIAAVHLLHYRTVAFSAEFIAIGHQLHIRRGTFVKVASFRFSKRVVMTTTTG